MAEGKFEDDLYTIGNQIGGFAKPEDFKFVHQDESVAKRLNKLVVFTARRAALEDASDNTANILKPRVAAVGIYVSGAPGEIVADVLEAFTQSATGNRFEYLAVTVLQPGSYGAILFVEDKEPTTREKFAAKLRGILADTAHRIGEKAKDKAVGVLITVTVLGAAATIGPHIPLTFVENVPTVVIVKCDDDKVFDMQRDIVGAHGSQDIQVAVNKYCKVVPNDPQNWLQKPAK